MRGVQQTVNPTMTRPRIRTHAHQVVEWLLKRYPVVGSLSVFLLLSTLLVECFLGYQLYLIAQVRCMGRWMDLHRGLLDLKYLT
jgi:hypothetical protein